MVINNVGEEMSHSPCVIPLAGQFVAPNTEPVMTGLPVCAYATVPGRMSMVSRHLGLNVLERSSSKEEEILLSSQKLKLKTMCVQNYWYLAQLRLFIKLIISKWR